MTDTDIAALVERLRSWVTDWDGSAMVRGTTPRDGMHCDVIYDAADALEACQAEIERLHVLVMDGVFDKARAEKAALELNERKL